MENRLLKYNEILLISTITLVLILIKAIIMLNDLGPNLFFDEYLYKEFAQALHNQGSYASTQYPPGYPYILSFAFRYDNFYQVMIIINIVVSSLLLVATWLLSREFLNVKTSVAISVIVAAFPYHYVFPRMLMSENLYFVLIILTAWAVLTNKIKNRYLQSAIVISLLIAMELTRYISIAVIPVMLTIYILKLLISKHGFRKITKKELIRLAIFVSVLSVLGFIVFQFVLSEKHANSIKELFGFGISGRVKSPNYTFTNFKIWTSFYLSYIALMIAPFLSLVLYSLVILGKELFDKTGKQKDFHFIFYTLMSYGVMAALSIPAIRHSWRMHYNYPVSLRINGRYVTYVFVLFLILGMVVLKKLTEKKWTLTNIIEFAIVLFISSYLIKISYNNIILGEYYSISKWFISFINGSDVIAFTKIENLVRKVIYINIFTGLVILLYRIKVLKYVLYSFIFYFYLTSSLSFNEQVLEYESRVTHGNELYEVLIHENIDDPSQVKIYNLTGSTLTTNIKYTLSFWDYNINHSNVISIGSLKAVAKITDGYLVTPTKISNFPYLSRYYVRNNDYYIYSLKEIDFVALYKEYVDYSQTDYLFTEGLHQRENGYKWSTKTSTFDLKYNDQANLNLELRFGGSYNVENPMISVYINNQLVKEIPITEEGNVSITIPLEDKKDLLNMRVNTITLKSNAELVKSPTNKDKRVLSFVVREIGFLD